MREIKFSYLYQHEDRGDFAECFYTLEEIENGAPDLYLEVLGHRWYLAEKRQYTGLKNKHGEEIYEGHIVEVWFPGIGYVNAQVVYTAPGFELRFAHKNKEYVNSGLRFFHDCKVIGDIQQNPELLEAIQ